MIRKWAVRGDGVLRLAGDGAATKDTCLEEGDLENGLHRRAIHRNRNCHQLCIRGDVAQFFTIAPLQARFRLPSKLAIVPRGSNT